MDVSFNIVIQESYYKVSNRWYLTPSRLHQMYPNNDISCWRCHKDVGTIMHIWWDCPNIVSFWIAFHQEINYWLNLPLQLSPNCCLLHLKLDIGKRDTVVLNNLFITAKMMIAKNWKSTTIPTLSQWRVKYHLNFLNEQINYN